jgi:outer membrane protein assembly factor BamB
VNCDGFDEIIVGAPGERVRDNEAQGRAYVFYGSTGTLRHTLDTPNPISDASFGWSICTGDVNCNGFEEVIVGAPGERVGDNEAQGRAYAFYGSTGTLRYTMDTPSSQPEASFGWSVCTGDVNCDGFEEVIVGAPGERVGDNMAQGRVYVFNGSTGTLRYTMDTPNPQPEASFGWSVCTGDVNCDGFEEIIVGAPGERVGDNMAQGRAYVFYGSTGTLHHTMDTPNPQPEASFGWSVCTGDVNCNGFEEVIVGAPGERVGDNMAQGRAYVFYGSTGTLHHTMDTPNPQSDALFGRSVCTGATSPP